MTARCDACRHWTPPSERTDDYRSAVVSASVVDGEDYFAQLYTAADFFCALWQPKEQP